MLTPDVFVLTGLDNCVKRILLSSTFPTGASLMSKNVFVSVPRLIVVADGVSIVQKSCVPLPPVVVMFITRDVPEWLVTVRAIYVPRLSTVPLTASTQF